MSHEFSNFLTPAAADVISSVLLSGAALLWKSELIGIRVEGSHTMLLMRRWKSKSLNERKKRNSFDSCHFSYVSCVRVFEFCVFFLGAWARERFINEIVAFSEQCVYTLNEPQNGEEHVNRWWVEAHGAPSRNEMMWKWTRDEEEGKLHSILCWWWPAGARRDFFFAAA